MFFQASSFNQNLCAWKDGLERSGISAAWTQSMFNGSDGEPNDGSGKFDFACILVSS
jgi:hypothetical protein